MNLPLERWESLKLRSTCIIWFEESSHILRILQGICKLVLSWFRRQSRRLLDFHIQEWFTSALILFGLLLFLLKGCCWRGHTIFSWSKRWYCFGIWRLCRPKTLHRSNFLVRNFLACRCTLREDHKLNLVRQLSEWWIQKLENDHRWLRELLCFGILSLPEAGRKMGF